MDDKNSVTADFQLLSYKVDTIKFSVESSLGVLQCKESIDSDRFQLGIKIRTPQKFIYMHDKVEYVGGLDIRVGLLSTEKEGREIATGEFGIAGIFKRVGTLQEELEEHMVKETIPSILLGYLRSIISSTFANAGFGSVIIPLININKLVQQSNLTIVTHQIPPENSDT
ncbi:MAG: protein-export chaperone SecB [Sphaerochaeta sp.]|nr:protein-export chaperone SecB [Sphaerochaeta sp.]